LSFRVKIHSIFGSVCQNTVFLNNKHWSGFSVFDSRDWLNSENSHQEQKWVKSWSLLREHEIIGPSGVALYFGFLLIIRRNLFWASPEISLEPFYGETKLWVIQRNDTPGSIEKVFLPQEIKKIAHVPVLSSCLTGEYSFSFLFLRSIVLKVLLGMNSLQEFRLNLAGFLKASALELLDKLIFLEQSRRTLLFIILHSNTDFSSNWNYFDYLKTKIMTWHLVWIFRNYWLILSALVRVLSKRRLKTKRLSLKERSLSLKLSTASATSSKRSFLSGLSSRPYTTWETLLSNCNTARFYRLCSVLCFSALMPHFREVRRRRP